jgi:hypothetical protein
VELHFARSRIQLAGVACLLAPAQGALDDLVLHTHRKLREERATSP